MRRAGNRDGHMRSLTKGISWRVIATADTVLLAYLFGGALSQALKIGLAEVLTKIVLFYLHERIWRVAPFGMIKKSGHITEASYRSVVKGISWRFFGTMDTILWSFIVLGNGETAFKIGAVELITKVVLFWAHERIWLRSSWGVQVAAAERADSFAERQLS